MSAMDPAAPLAPIKIGDRLFDFSRTYIMGVVNVTPDSFYDGGRHRDTAQAVEHGLRLIEDGADIVDVGGESTRPGAEEITEEEEMDRVLPVIEELARQTDIPVSVDTRKSVVAMEALNCGAAMVNDVSAGRHDPDMFAVICDHDVPIVLMHMAGSPKTMQQHIHYENLIEDIIAFFRESIRLARAAGVQEESIWLDPGIGFGKTKDHNLQLIKNLGLFKTLRRPLLIGPSRKAFIGAITGEPPDGRIFGTAASVSAGILFGANMLRVHDVREMKQVAMLMDDLIRVPSVL